MIVQDGRILLIKRAVEPSKGKWSIPGGGVEWGEPLVEALKREVREETGLEIEVGDIAGVYDLIVEGEGASTINHQPSTIPRHSSRITYHYVIIDYFAGCVRGDLRPGDDAAEVRWVPLDELGDYELSGHLRERLRQMGVISTS